jgi:hypothetical protein
VAYSRVPSRGDISADFPKEHLTTKINHQLRLHLSSGGIPIYIGIRNGRAA